MVFIAEVEHIQDGLELVQDLIVSGHVCGQDTPGRAEVRQKKQCEKDGHSIFLKATLRKSMTVRHDPERDENID